MNQIQAFLPFILMIVIFYFLLIRPQQKRQKERNRMLNSLKKGDKIITTGGVHGSIVDLTDDRITLKVSDTLRLTFERWAVYSVDEAEVAVAAEVDEKKQKSKKAKDKKQEVSG